jgi:hypothetical protein
MHSGPRKDPEAHLDGDRGFSSCFFLKIKMVRFRKMAYPSIFAGESRSKKHQIAARDRRSSSNTCIHTQSISTKNKSSLRRCYYGGCQRDRETRERTERVRERNGVLATQGIDVAYNVLDMSAKKSRLSPKTDSLHCSTCPRRVTSRLCGS